MARRPFESAMKLFSTVRCSSRREEALTLLEVVIIIAVLIFVAAFLLPMFTNPRTSPSFGIRCLNNLKETSHAFQMWASDFKGRFPMEVSTNEGGTKEFVEGSDVSRHFKPLIAYVGHRPKVFVCPADTERTPADLTNHPDIFRNEDVSYFIGIDASASNNSRKIILSGDRNVSDTDKIQHGIFSRGTTQSVNWTKELHSKNNKNRTGNILLASGEAYRVSNFQLQQYWKNTGVPTNRLALP